MHNVEESRGDARLDGTLSRRLLQIVIAARAVYDGSIYLVNMHAVPDDVGIEARLQMDYTFFKSRRRVKAQLASAKGRQTWPAWLASRVHIFSPVSQVVRKRKEGKRERERERERS